jgi:hypothetical protein
VGPGTVFAAEICGTCRRSRWGLAGTRAGATHGPCSRLRLAPAVGRNCARIREIAPHKTGKSPPGPTCVVSLTKRSHVHFPVCLSRSYTNTPSGRALLITLIHCSSTHSLGQRPTNNHYFRITTLLRAYLPTHTKLETRLRPSFSRRNIKSAQLRHYYRR